MRHSLLPEGLPEISYGIRQIVSKGFEREALGYPVIWENIGDPVQKGLQLPEWMRDIVAEQIQDNSTYGYCDSKGLPETRQFLADRTNSYGGQQITKEDITFFNGLGDAIARFYSLLSNKTRVLMPSPTYPAHTGAEKLRIGENPLTYELNPGNGWLPDTDSVREIVQNHKEISCLLIINPDNPTGMVYPKKVLLEMVQIAREFDLFIVADEIYENLVHDGQMVRMAEVIGDVPALVMKGISKEIPWPGSRCGWIEYYNRGADEQFNNLCTRIDQCKMTEVCSTTLPQKVLPGILDHPDYETFLDERKQYLTKKARLLKERVKSLDGIFCAGARGAFYATLHTNETFSLSDVNHNVLPEKQQDLFKSWTADFDGPSDLYLVYFLLAGAGVCTVPLSGFNCHIPGIRITLLEQDLDTFEHMLDQLMHGLESVFNGKKSLIQA
ncbi:pyridoxal phosphate-dependent aminotransferase [Rhodohalobacter sp. 8-1]|uniref:pyridoxal phosphate-dependent aminotransferase n=1 Tax=Rhodohalobacter sp. 8-1 TaxID=3131972 RepID=UPI0030EDCE11